MYEPEVVLPQRSVPRKYGAVRLTRAAFGASRAANTSEMRARIQRGGRSTFPRFTPEARKANQPVVDLLSGVAKRKNATRAQIALACS